MAHHCDGLLGTVAFKALVGFICPSCTAALPVGRVKPGNCQCRLSWVVEAQLKKPCYSSKAHLCFQSMGIKSSAFHRSDLPAFLLLAVHREPWMRLTKAFCWTPPGRLPHQQLARSGVTLTTFIPSRPFAPNTSCQSHKLPALLLIPWDMSDLSTCFCTIKAISHLANGTWRKRVKLDKVQPQRQAGQ